jgi:acetoacetate decarboxylase
MLNGIEITTPWATYRRIRQAIKNGLKMWDGARFILADVPLDKKQASAILPWGLKLTDPPTATLFICDYPKTAFTGAYKEAAVLVHVKTLFGTGVHCCWMVVDDDTALILGREVLGYPKKMADIKYQETDSEVSARVTRRGVTVLSLVGRKGPPQNPAPPVFDIKTFNVSGPGQMYMIQPIWLFRAKEVIHESYQAEVEVTIRESAHDPIKALVSGNPVSGRLVVMDIVGSHYSFPVGVAGPSWVMKTYWMRFR